MTEKDDPTTRGIAALCATAGQFALLLDEAFDIVWHTQTLTTILGYETIVGRNGVEFVHPDDVGLIVELLAKVDDLHASDSTAGPAFRADPTDIRLLASSGAWLPIEAVTFDQTGDPAIRGFLVTCKLITDRSDVGRSIELLGTGANVDEVLALIARLVDRSMGMDSRCAVAWWHDDDVQVTWSPDGPMPDVRMAEAVRMALRSGVLEAMTITDFDHPILHGAGAPARELGYLVANLIPIVAPSRNEVIGCVLSWGHHPLEFALHPQVALHMGLRIAALAIMDDRSRSNLRWTASHDPLTLLINRAQFARELDAMDHETVALLYIDLDDFKPINDVHGHSVGDAVLVEVAARIRETVGIVGIVGRLGGDEFAIACAGLGHTTDGWILADRVIAAVGRPIRVGDITVAVGASIGVAVGIQPLIPSVLVQRADEAMLEAKHAGKNTVKIAA